MLLEHATIFHNNNLNNQVVEEGRTKREAYADGDEIFNNVSDEDDDVEDGGERMPALLRIQPGYLG